MSGLPRYHQPSLSYYQRQDGTWVMEIAGGESYVMPTPPSAVNLALAANAAAAAYLKVAVQFAAADKLDLAEAANNAAEGHLAAAAPLFQQAHAQGAGNAMQHDSSPHGPT
jgi:hypothetical protein